jgi:hypothetical protein
MRVGREQEIQWQRVGEEVGSGKRRPCFCRHLIRQSEGITRVRGRSG